VDGLAEVSKNWGSIFFFAVYALIVFSTSFFFHEQINQINQSRANNRQKVCLAFESIERTFTQAGTPLPQLHQAITGLGC
jgi:hypothetical protein